MTAAEKLEEYGYEDVICFSDYGEETLIGVDVNNRAVYDYEKMVQWLIEQGDCTEEEAVD